MAETSDVDDFVTRRNFTFEMVHLPLGAFSVARQLGCSDQDMYDVPRPSCQKYSGFTIYLAAMRMRRSEKWELSECMSNRCYTKVR